MKKFFLYQKNIVRKKLLAIFPYYRETIIGRNGSFCFNPNLFSVVYILTRSYFSSFCIYNNIF